MSDAGRSRRDRHRPGVESSLGRVQLAAGPGRSSRRERSEEARQPRRPPRAAGGQTVVRAPRTAAPSRVPQMLGEASGPAPRLPVVLSLGRGRIRACRRVVRMRRATQLWEQSRSGRPGVPDRVGTAQVAPGARPARPVDARWRRRSPTSRSRASGRAPGSVANLVRDGPPMPARWDRTAALVRIRGRHPMVWIPALAPSQVARTTRVPCLRGGCRRRLGRLGLLANEVTVDRLPKVRIDRRGVGPDAAGPRRHRLEARHSDDQLPPIGGNPAGGAQRVVGLRLSGRTTPAVRLVDSWPG